MTRLSEYGISHLSDNVVLLQFLRGESQIKRALTVLKTRASAHDPHILEFEITSNGIELGGAVHRRAVVGVVPLRQEGHSGLGFGLLSSWSWVLLPMIGSWLPGLLSC